LVLWRFENVSGSAQGIKKVAYYISEVFIHHVEWFSRNTLWIFDERRDFKVLYSWKLRSCESQNKAPFEYSQAIMNSTNLLNVDREIQDIRNQSFNRPDQDESTSLGSVVYYNNTIIGSEIAKRIFIMGEKKMIVGKHFEWKEYIEDLLKKAEWLMAFSLCISFYRGLMRKFAEIPNDPEQRKARFKKLATRLVKSYINKMKDMNNLGENSEEVWKTIMLTAIDFLVSMESYETLFGEICPLFYELGMKTLFLTSLEPFILANRVAKIPTEIFQQMINYYAVQDKAGFVQHMIMNLPIDQSNFEFILMYCIEMNYSKALLHLCFSNTEKIHVESSPISQAMVIYDHHIETESLETPEKKLLFLRFLNIIITNNQEKASWEGQLKEMIKVLFTERTVDFIIQADAFIAFDLFKLFFQPPAANILKSCSFHLKIDNTPRRSMQGQTQEILQGSIRLNGVITRFMQCFQNPLQAQMLGLIYHCSKKNAEKQIENNLYYMLCDLGVNFGYDLPLDVTEECVNYLFYYPRELAPWKQSDEISEEEAFKKSNEERSFLAIELLEKAKAYISEEKKEKLAQLAEEVNL